MYENRENDNFSKKKKQFQIVQLFDRITISKKKKKIKNRHDLHTSLPPRLQ